MILIVFLYHFAYHVGKDLGRDLEVVFIVFGMIWDRFLNVFGNNVDKIVLLLFILFPHSFQIMRGLCQEDCEADVSILLRSRCQSDFQIVRSLCQEEQARSVKVRRGKGSKG